jgi:hypothetical protein
MIFVCEYEAQTSEIDVKKIINIFWILFISSCATKPQINGKYFSKKSLHKFQIKPDSTFTYEYGLISLYQHSMGKWKLEGKNIILNSWIKSTIMPIEMVKIEQIAPQNNILSFELKTKGNLKLEYYRCSVYLNDNIEYQKRCDSLSNIFANFPINKIQVYFSRMPKEIRTTLNHLAVGTSAYLPDTQMGQKIQMRININDSLFYYRAFKNDILKVRKNRIKFYDIEGKRKYRRYIIPKVKDSIKIFLRYNDDSRILKLF